VKKVVSMRESPTLFMLTPDDLPSFLAIWRALYALQRSYSLLHDSLRT
jgi:hypothetical protein